MKRYFFGIPLRLVRPFVLAVCLKYYLGLSSAAIAAEFNAAAVVVPLGSFGSIQIVGDHCNGQSIDLWKSAESILGVVNSCAGLIETKITSIIANQHYNQNKGTVEFTISLSVGTDYLRGGKEVPSDDVWGYHLRIRGNILSGAVTMSDRNFPQEKSKIKSLSLKRQTRNLPSFGSLDDWTQWASARLSKK